MISYRLSEDSDDDQMECSGGRTGRGGESLGGLFSSSQLDSFLKEARKATEVSGSSRALYMFFMGW